MAVLEIRLLGIPAVSIEGIPPVQFPTRSVLALLAYLSEESLNGRPHPRGYLAELLWPGMPAGSGRKNLRQTLYALKRLLPESDAGKFLIATRTDLQWERSAPARVDTHRFENLARSQDAEKLIEAESLYRGEFMDGFTLPDSPDFESWVRNRAEYYLRAYRGVLLKLIDADPARAARHARRLVETDPLDESAVRALMTVLAGSGARTEAIQQFNALRERLRLELGIDPEHETGVLLERISKGSPPDRPGAAAPVEELSHARVRLPAAMTPFIGRSEEIEHAAAILRSGGHRLLSFIGPGGSGKTRLAIETASAVSDSFPDGVFFIPLGAAENEDGLVSTLVGGLDLTMDADEPPRMQVMTFLSDKALLLVLDNFEQLAAFAGLLPELLSEAPGVKILVTSRVVLNVQGEQLFPVGGLTFPERDELEAEYASEIPQRYSGVSLFIERARRVKPGFEPAPANIPAIVEICRLLEGMPLAIELAAAWMSLLRIGEIVAEIARSLDFLEADWADVPARQRSLRAVFESSWTLLDETERRIIKWLTVFTGTFSREAAQQVTGASLRNLLGLTNKSWLHQAEEGRFQLHDLLRQYAGEKLAGDESEREQAYRAHADFYSGFVAEQTRLIRGPEQVRGLDGIEREFNENIRTAWEWLARTGNWDLILDRMILGLSHYVGVRIRIDELMVWLQAARQRFLPEPAAAERLPYAVLGTLEIYCEEQIQIKDYQPVQRLRTIWDFANKHGLAEEMGFWFVMLAALVRARDLDSSAQQALDEAVRRIRIQGDRWLYGYSLLLQSNVLTEFEYSEDLVNEAGVLFAELGVPYEQGRVADLQARIAMLKGRPLVEIMEYFNRAKTAFQEVRERSQRFHIGRTIARYFLLRGMIEEGFAEIRKERREIEKIRHPRWLAGSLKDESEAALRFSTFEHALTTSTESLALAEKFTNRTDLNWWLFGHGEIYRVYGYREQAMEAYDRAAAGFESLSMTLGLAYLQRAYGDMAIEDGRFDDGHVHFLSFLQLATLDNHIWSIAQAQGKVSWSYAHLGDVRRSREHGRAALELIRNWGELDLGVAFLLAEAVCRAAEGEVQQAAVLAEFVRGHPSTWNEYRFAAERMLASLSDRLSEAEFKAARERASGMDLDDLLDGLRQGPTG